MPGAADFLSQGTQDLLECLDHQTVPTADAAGLVKSSLLTNPAGGCAPLALRPYVGQPHPAGVHPDQYPLLPLHGAQAMQGSGQPGAEGHGYAPEGLLVQLRQLAALQHYMQAALL